MTDTDLRASVMEFVRTQISRHVKLPAERIEPGSDLIGLGLQSIDAVIMCGEVEDRFRVELDPSTIFEHDTVGSFVDGVVLRLADG